METNKEAFEFDYSILNIKINGSNPIIWRRVVVPEDITLDRLSDVILLLFSWEGYESCMFKIKNKFYENLEDEYEYEDEDEEEGKVFDITLHRLNELVKEKSRFIMYYNEWEIGVFVESTRFHNETNSDIYCLNGDNNSPPPLLENMAQFNALIEDSTNTDSPLNESAIQLLGNDFEETRFSKGLYNFLLNRYCEWARDRNLPLYDLGVDKEKFNEILSALINEEIGDMLKL